VLNCNRLTARRADIDGISVVGRNEHGSKLNKPSLRRRLKCVVTCRVREDSGREMNSWSGQYSP